MAINYYKQGNSIVKTIGVLDLPAISESEYNDLMSKVAEKIDKDLADQQHAPEPTPEERIAALEDELAAAKILLGLEE